MNRVYSAITIGPIYETLERARKTRALWASSYFFSWFMKNLIIKLNEAGYTLLLPASKCDELHYNDPKCLVFQSNYGAGLYADRIYFSYEKPLNPSPQEIIEELLKTASSNLKNFKIDINYLREYINLHVVQIEDKSDIFPLQALNDLLDLAELHPHAPLIEGEAHQLAETFENIDSESFLYRDAYTAFNKPIKGDYRIFPSIPEITTYTLKDLLPQTVVEEITKNKEKKDEDDYFKILRSKNVKYYPFHKYYALIMADGDGVGKILKELAADAHYGIKILQRFSKILFEFSLEAEEIFYNYGGRLVYGGGDDLMALAPMVGQEGNNLKTLFHLIEQLDKAFDKKFRDFICELNQRERKYEMPSLSYGIMICYYKHPLKEAREEAQELLSKKYLGDKNIVAIRFQKHSGQQMEAMIHKNQKITWDRILQLTSENKYLPFYNEDKYTYDNENTKPWTPIQLKKNDLLSGVIHRLKDEIFETAFIEALKAGKLENFIKNSFNESIHKNNDFLKEFTCLAESAFKEHFKNCDKSYEERIKKFKNTLYMVLRYIHFINSEKERE